MEELKDVPGYEGLYQVSNEGYIKSLPKSWFVKNGGEFGHNGKLLKPNLTGRGYYKCILSKDLKTKTFLVHRLVAEAFIPNPENKPQVNHINGIKTDNRVENLEWATAKENITHADSTNLRNNRGELNGITTLKEEDVLKIRELYSTGKYSSRKLASMFNVKSKSTILRIVNRVYWTHI